MGVSRRLLRRLRRWARRGSCRRLRSLLRRHPEICGAGAGGSSAAGAALISASRRGHASVVRLLLRRGVDGAATRGRGGETAAHAVVHRALRRPADKGCLRVIALLRKYCPDCLQVRNLDGITAAHLLARLPHQGGLAEQQEEAVSLVGAMLGERGGWGSEEEGPWGSRGEDSAWLRRVQDECEDEYNTAWGRYEDDFEAADGNGSEPETFEGWVQRLAREQRERSRPGPSAAELRRRRLREERERREERWRQELRATLATEHSERQRRAAAASSAAADAAAAAKESYERRLLAAAEKLARSAESAADSAGGGAQRQGELRYDDIPWPAPHGTAEEMAAVLAHGVDRTEEGGAPYRRHLRRQLVLWHPDKFEQRFGARLHVAEREGVLRTVKELSQALNRLMGASAT
ncbi:NF-kappa-B inhibitor-like protein 1 [Lethenteron reissneri]|uniref:NF-kappa-B inhibitor-like protein 1 n=1 Tax=Lethenteron reissneri TaxID=7753 RepID=UPI002AB6EBF4|nr:NF-kappa-B inhibitor-like protein 1 [Lethenteron reissneri]XP_061434647.1 NF-kappa-B inhibitor-like protein 1 [Lethenteron reissneri]XP_061434649.1 NF-kappa-B inhibitor-like protein 1 [Lethenteron reissneri]XP_061434650.1 NF-kappa-B inhibitor-like protein 1 [Lethenteron reissneri]